MSHRAEGAAGGRGAGPDGAIVLGRNEDDEPRVFGTAAVTTSPAPGAWVGAVLGVDVVVVAGRVGPGDLGAGDVGAGASDWGR